MIMYSGQGNIEDSAALSRHLLSSYGNPAVTISALFNRIHSVTPHISRRKSEKMNFLLVVSFPFLVSIAVATSVCSEDICRACSMIDDSHPFCQKMAASKCCDAWLNENHHSLVPSANEEDFAKQMTSVPEIFEEKEGAQFTVSNITVMCLSLVAFVMLVCKLERIIARIMKKKPSEKYYKDNRQWTSESQEFLL